MNRVKKVLATGTAAGFLLFEIAAPAEAAACFRPPEIEADQAMRYQTQLMVLDDTCGGDFYRDFTVRNREQIMAYQTELKDYFRRVGARSPAASLDSFLTRIANELALREGQSERAEVCAREATVIAEARTLDTTHFKSLAAALATENRSSYKSCR